MATEKLVTYGGFGDSRTVSYDKVGTSGDASRGGTPEWESHPAKEENYNTDTLKVAPFPPLAPANPKQAGTT
jgi:hypothetical protein